MVDLRQFLTMSLGCEQTWAVTVETGQVLAREWVRLQDGPQVKAIRHDGTQVTLGMLDRAKLAAVRRWLRDAPTPRLVTLEHDGSHGLLRTQHCALPASLDAAPTLLLDPAVSKKFVLQARALAEQMVVPGGDGWVLVVRTPVLIADALDMAQPMVTLWTHGGLRLDAELVGAPGRQYLAVRDVTQEGTRLTLADVRLIRVPALPLIVSEERDVRPIDLSVMAPHTHPLLHALIAYESAAHKVAAVALGKRQNVPLEYVEVVEHVARQFVVVLAEGGLALQHWLTIPPKPKQTRHKLGVTIQIASLAGSGELVDGELKELFEQPGSEQVHARLQLNDPTATPPARGRIVPTANRGDARQKERKHHALERLRTGRSANPDLLRHLYHPDLAPAAVRSSGKSRGASMLAPAQVIATLGAAAGPPLFLVQGPPGTGKTTVILEIIREVQLRRRKSSGDGGLRVLVTSVQGEAVLHVKGKLGREHDVHWLPGRDERQAYAAQLASEARERAQALARRVRELPEWAAMEALRACAERLTSARMEFARDRDARALLVRLADVREFEKLTPSLLGEWRSLAASAHEPIASQTGTQAPPSEATDSVLRAFQGIVLAPSVWSAEHAKAIHTALTCLAETTEQPSAVLGDDALELAERARSLLRRLNLFEQSGREPSTAVLQLWPELRTAIAASLNRTGSAAGDAPVAAPEVSLALRTAAWLERARVAVDSMRAHAATTEVGIISDWLHTLHNEPGQFREITKRHAPIVAATCQQALPRPGQEEPTYDLVIVDEAGRAGIDLLIPMTMGRSVVLIGDQNQLPPHVESEIALQMEQQAQETLNEQQSLFAWLWDRVQPSNRVTLTRQFRMHEDIGRLVSRTFYEPDVVLDHYFRGPLAESARRPCFGILGNSPVVWVDTADVLKDPHELRSRDLALPCDESNPYEAELAIALVCAADRSVLKALEKERGEPPIGLICFYGRQLELIDRLLARLDPELRRLVCTGKVDSFQGREFPLVLLSTSRSNGSGFCGFLRMPQRINVALSRAQRQVILLGDSTTLAQDSRTPLGRVHASCLASNEPGRVVASLKALS
jgi:DNA polymerase III delta prime subunit